MSAGFVINLAYTVYKLNTNHTWGNFFPGKQGPLAGSINIARTMKRVERPWYYASRGGIGNWLYSMLMGLLWYTGL